MNRLFDPCKHTYVAVAYVPWVDRIFTIQEFNGREGRGREKKS